MSIQHVVQHPLWRDSWLAALTVSAGLAGLLWRLEDRPGVDVALWISATCIAAIVASAANESLVRHCRADRVDDGLNSN
jgi:hypothetical protein